jgi:hypothetical protein
LQLNKFMKNYKNYLVINHIMNNKKSKFYKVWMKNKFNKLLIIQTLLKKVLIIFLFIYYFNDLYYYFIKEIINIFAFNGEFSENEK